MDTLNLSDRSGKRSSNKLAAEQATAQLQVAEQKGETSFMARTAAAEERLTRVSLAVEALEGRVGALVEDFRGRIEGTLQAFQGKGARQAKDLEKIAQLLGERWFQQFREQGNAAVERLREELKNSGRVVEESKQQLASLAEAKLAALSQATREEYGQQLAQAFREHAQAMHEPADVEVESIKLAAEQAIAQLQVAEQKGETGFMARAGAAEERLTGVSLAVEALEGRVGALVEDFQGRIEGTLQALQGKGARQAEDLEKIAQDLGGRWSQQFQEQADAAVERLREELKNSGRVVEESKQQLASLAEAKLVSLSQATREEDGQQLAQAFREHAQAMHEAADVEVESIKLAAERAIAQLQVAEQKRETGFMARAGAAEERLTGVSLAVEALEGRVGALVEDFRGPIEGTLQALQGKGARQAEDLEKIAQDLGGRWSQQFQEQADAAVERLREELKNSGRVVEESKQQLASLAEAKLASLSQATREEYGQQLAQAFREHAQAMHEAADVEVESIKLAAEQAIAQLQVAEQKSETGFMARAGAAEERLTGVSLAVEALEGRVGALVEDFQGRIEGTLQAFQWKGARQAEDLEKIAQDLGGRWSQQFQKQADAAVERLREELKNSGRVVEESKQQLASLAEAKLASLSQATREEYGQQLAQAFREHAQVMHEAADVEVESIKLAAERAIAQLQVAEQKSETGFMARAGAAEEHLTGVSLAAEALEGRVGALVEDFQGRIEGTLQALQGKGARQAEDLEKIAQDLGGRWSQQFQGQADAAVERLREELKNSGRVVEESKQQLASLAKVKLAVLSQVADNATAGLEAEQRRLKNQYETSRRELEGLLEGGWTKPPSPSLQRGSRPKRRGVIAQLALVAGVCLVIMVPLLGVYLSARPVMRLQPEAPAEFIDQSPNWSAKRRAREEEVAQAYWQVAVVGLQERYPFGSELPAEPPTEFQVENKYVPPGSAKAFSEARERYWEKLRRSWVQRQSWVERHEWNTQWAARLRHIWEQLRLPK
jgi:Ni,Fe-hydrogenase maturation factor